MRLQLYFLFFLLDFSVCAFPKTVLDEHLHWLGIEKQQDTLTLYPKEKIPAFAAKARELLSPADSLIAKLLAIKEAKHSIDLVTYIFKKDAVGYLTLYEIRQAIKRGVSVRLMVDSTGSFGFTHAELKSLLAVPAGEMLDQSSGRKKAFVEVRIFNSIFHWKHRINRIFKRNVGPRYDYADKSSWGRFLNRRSHDKYLGIDIQYPELAIGFIGGRNVSEAYHGIPETAKSADKTYNDADMIFRNDPRRYDAKNKLDSTIGDHFNRLFYRQRNKVLTANFFHLTDKRHWKKMDAAAAKVYSSMKNGKNIGDRLREMKALNYLSADFHNVEMELLTEIQNVNREHKFWEFVKKIFAPNKVKHSRTLIKNPNSIMLNIKQRMAQATSTIHIITPYLFLTTSTSSYIDKRWQELYPEIEVVQKGDIELFVTWLKNDSRRRLRIITNSILTTDNLPAQAMVDLDVAPVMVDFAKRAGVLHQLDFRELGTLKAKKFGGTESYGKLHAKLAMIDYKITLVTTSNGDPRSRKINSEIGFLVHSDKFTLDYIKYFERLRSQSYQVYSPEWKQMVTHRKIRLKKFISTSLYRCISWFSRWLL